MTHRTKSCVDNLRTITEIKRCFKTFTNEILYTRKGEGGRRRDNVFKSPRSLVLSKSYCSISAAQVTVAQPIIHPSSGLFAFNGNGVFPKTTMTKLYADSASLFEYLQFFSPSHITMYRVYIAIWFNLLYSQLVQLNCF